jgi:hypothetical protein
MIGICSSSFPAGRIPHLLGFSDMILTQSPPETKPIPYLASVCDGEDQLGHHPRELRVWYGTFGRWDKRAQARGRDKGSNNVQHPCWPRSHTGCYRTVLARAEGQRKRESSRYCNRDNGTTSIQRLIATAKYCPTKGTYRPEHYLPALSNQTEWLCWISRGCDDPNVLLGPRLQNP